MYPPQKEQGIPILLGTSYLVRPPSLGPCTNDRPQANSPFLATRNLHEHELQANTLQTQGAGTGAQSPGEGGALLCCGGTIHRGGGVLGAAEPLGSHCLHFVSLLSFKQHSPSRLLPLRPQAASAVLLPCSLRAMNFDTDGEPGMDAVAQPTITVQSAPPSSLSELPRPPTSVPAPLAKALLRSSQDQKAAGLLVLQV